MAFCAASQSVCPQERVRGDRGTTNATCFFTSFWFNHLRVLCSCAQGYNPRACDLPCKCQPPPPPLKEKQGFTRTLKYTALRAAPLLLVPDTCLALSRCVPHTAKHHRKGTVPLLLPRHPVQASLLRSRWPGYPLGSQRCPPAKWLLVCDSCRVQKTVHVMRWRQIVSGRCRMTWMCSTCYFRPAGV